MAATIDQTRPDQTRPDYYYAFKSLKVFLRRYDRFHILSSVYRKVSGIIYTFRYSKDRIKHNSKSAVQYSNTPYIIRRAHRDVGLFSYFNTILGGISYAEKNGYIPVIDMKNYPNTYLFHDEVGHVNSWEYYFEQPGGLSLDDALSCGKYILGRDTLQHKQFTYAGDDKENIAYWRGLCRKYIRFKQPVVERVGEMQKKFSGMRVLGVHVRGTDYITGYFKGHDIQPTAAMTIAKAREAMRTEKFDAVYLSTEDKNIVAEFQSAFGEKLLLPDVHYVDYDPRDGRPIDDFHANRENYKYLSGLDYVVSILFLTKCSGLIASKNNGTIAALLLSEGFDYLYVFDLGKY